VLRGIADPVDIGDGRTAEFEHQQGQFVVQSCKTMAGPV